MSLLRGPQDWEQPDRSHTSEPFVPRKSTRGSVARIGRGTLACPSCDVPIVAAAAIRVSARMRCPFCRRIHPARRYLRLDDTDTELNEVQVTARIEL